MLFCKSLASKLTLLLVLAAILPLTVFGIVAVWQARTTASEAVLTGNLRVAMRASEQIGQYVRNSAAILRSTAENVSRADLKPWQRERVIRNMVLEFDEFSEILITDADGVTEAISGVGESRIERSPYWNKALEKAVLGESYYSPVFITDELTPSLIMALPVSRMGEVDGTVMAEIDLLNMWRLVDRIRIGESGYMNVVLQTGKLIASGDGELKRLVLQEKDYPDMATLRLSARDGEEKSMLSGRDSEGGELIIAATTLPKPFSWIVMMEQPASEAFAHARRLTWLLTGLVAIFIIIMYLLGFFGAKWQIVQPVKELIGGTRKIAMGDLDYKVDPKSDDELGELAASFNTMAGELSNMQDNIRKQERLAIFGRIASSLAHDLKHPIRSIENITRLMEEMHNDPEYRETFRRVVEREFVKINEFLDNLKTISHDIPYHPVDVSLNDMLDEVSETFAMEASKKGVEIKKNYGVPNARIYADKFSMTRAFSNLVSNAIQAIEGPGVVTVTTLRDGINEDAVTITVEDSGCGIPPDRIETIFSDFVTTKRKGLGLGLVLTKRIFDQHHATISVASDPGHGSKFSISIRTRPA